MLGNRISASDRADSVDVSAEVDERGKEPPRQVLLQQPLLCWSVIVAAPENLLREKDGVVAVGEHLAPHLGSDGAAALAIQLLDPLGCGCYGIVGHVGLLMDTVEEERGYC